MMGHGAQKLFGSFGGGGLKGTAGWMESMGMKPGQPWALLAGGSEFGGGLLTLLGLLNPVGPLGIIGSMSMATAKAHWGKPIWVTSGGAELPATNIALALAMGLAGPGRLSLDTLMNIHLPRRFVLVPGLLLSAAGVAAGVISSRQQPQDADQEQDITQEQQADAPQEAAEEQAPAVPISVGLGTHPLEGEEGNVQQPNRVDGAHMQSGQEAQNPL